MRQAGHHCVGGFCIICSTGLLMQEDLKDTQLFLPLLLSLPIFFSPSKMSSLFSHKFITLSSALKKKKKESNGSVRFGILPSAESFEIFAAPRTQHLLDWRQWCCPDGYWVSLASGRSSNEQDAKAPCLYSGWCMGDGSALPWASLA